MWDVQERERERERKKERERERECVCMCVFVFVFVFVCVWERGRESETARVRQRKMSVRAFFLCVSLETARVRQGFVFLVSNSGCRGGEYARSLASTPPP